MAVALDKFLGLLEESGLIPREDLAALLAEIPSPRKADGEQLARELVKRKKLTAYQAQEVYGGRGKKLVLGNYVIQDKLGQGGMGMVLKAEHRRMERIVALKVMSKAAVESPEAVKRFHREVKAAAKLTHPNIVNAFDADEANGTHFLVMEFVEGTDLSQLVKKNGPVAVEKAVTCILQAARGLEFAHEHGIVHRDIKPANLLLDPKGNVKILDMGLARIESIGGEQAELTGTGQIMGTVDYMAPEQAVNTRKADHRADIYALGISLWYLLTGKTAYAGETVIEKLMAHQSAPIPSLTELRQDVSPALEAVFRKMVAKTPPERYQSMAEVIAALEKSRGKLGDVSPTVTLGPSEDAKLNAFLKGGGALSSGTAAVASAPSNAVAGSTGAELEQTIVTAGPQVDTDPQTQTGLHAPPVTPPAPFTFTALPPAAQKPAPPESGLHGPIWTRPLTLLIAGGTAGGLVLLLAIWGVWHFLSDRAPAKIEIPPGGSATIVSADGPGVKPAIVSPPNVKPAGPDAGGLVFDGKSSVVTPAEPAVLSNLATIEAWVRPTASGIHATEHQGLTGHIYRNHQFMGALSLEWTEGANGSHYWSFATFDTNGVLQSIRSTDPCELGRRAHVAGVFDGQELTLFVNGRKQGSARHVAKPAPMSLVPMTLGGNESGLGTFIGTINGLRVSKSARYREDFSPKPRLESDAETVVLYQCDQGSGEVLADSSENKHHGKIKGAKWVRVAAPSSSKAPASAIAPFTMAEANAYQDAWAAHLGVPREWENGLGMKFVLIPPGEFTMGSTKEEIAAIVAANPGMSWAREWLESETPQKRVTIARPFYLGMREVTVGQFRRFVKEKSYKTVAERMGGGTRYNPDKNEVEVDPAAFWNAPGIATADDLPVHFLVAEDAREFHAWLSAETRVQCSLPTEAQWEFACRAGTTTRWFFGDTPGRAGDYAWVLPDANIHPGGEKLANPFGLYDMCGNVQELALNESGKAVLRGGDRCADPPLYRSAMRRPVEDRPWESWGFRSVADPETVRRSLGPPQEFVPLFNRQDLTGWKSHPGYPGNWRAEKGVLFGSCEQAPFTYLFSERGDYSDFHLLAETRVAEGTSAGITIRAPYPVPGPPAPKPLWGYVAKINASNNADGHKTGSLYFIERTSFEKGNPVRTSPVPAGEWCKFEVIAEGERVRVIVNGVTTTDFRDPTRLYLQGHIALQVFQGRDPVEFRRLEIKELPRPKTVPALEFDGKASFAKGAPPPEVTTAEVTIEAWVTPTASGTYGGIRKPLTGHIYRNHRKMNGALALQYTQLDGGSHEWRFAAFSEQGQPFSISSLTPCELGKLVHVAGVWNGKELSLYVDGRKQGPGVPFTSAAGVSCWPLTIGGSELGAGSLVGRCQALRISKTARYAADFIPEPLLKADEATIALYRFDEGSGDVLHDASSGKHDCTIVAPKWVRVPATGDEPLLRFDGVDDYVELPQLPHMEPGALLTVEAWATLEQPIGLQDGRCVFELGPLKVGADGTPKGVEQWRSAVFAPKFVALPTGQQAVLGRRTHVAVVLDPQGIVQYIDGKEELRKTYEDLGWSPRTFWVDSLLKKKILVGAGMASPANRGHVWPGTVDELRISTSRRYAGDFAPQSRFELDADTLALYHFDEGQGTVLKDSSPNRRDGKIVGASWAAAGSPPAIAPRGAGKGFALGFEGKDEVVGVSAVKIPARGPWTVEGWVTPRAPFPKSGPEAELVFMVGSCWLSVRQGPKWALGGPVTNQSTTIYSLEKAIPDRPTHIAVTRGPEGVSFFVNGVPQPGVPMQIFANGPSVELRICQVPNSSRKEIPFFGEIDEVHVSKVVRYAGPFTPKLRFEPDADTIALYHFDEGGGDVLRDASTNKHDGKMTGAKWVPAPAQAAAGGAAAQRPKPAASPFDAAQAKEHQQAWAKCLGREVEEPNSVSMKLVVIPPGQFTMGRSPREPEVFAPAKLPDDDLPTHSVTLTKAFAIAATEVTQKQWQEVMGTTPWVGKPQIGESDDCPATYVSWKDAREFCKRLSDKEQAEYRLPTEAEWEWACRAGTQTSFSFGDGMKELHDHAWARGNSQDRPHPVAAKKPNAWGLFDMHGNAWEWAEDAYGPFSAEAAVDPHVTGSGNPQAKRTLRGGCFWSVPTSDYRSSARRAWPETLGYSESGFRPILVLPAKNPAAAQALPP